MTEPHRFGGDWTSDKLERVRKYLTAYRQIFESNRKAQYFKTVYVDAFAGTGSRAHRPDPSAGLPSLFEEEDAESVEVMKGSVTVALDLPSPFDHYLFIDRDPAHVRDLEGLKSRARTELSKRIEIVEGDANEVLRAWCRKTDWARTRAVVFLDPYGMQVEWATLEQLASTKAVDLWTLFPLGQAVSRMLTRDRLPPAGWAAALDRFLGTEEWRKAFYREVTQESLFGEETSVTRNANYVAIGRFFVGRLRTIFADASEQPLVLQNSKGVPIYLLCFAASNKKGAPTAMRIANHILGAGAQ